MHTRLHLLILYQIINKTRFPFLSRCNVAEPSPDMNIKVAAFTVSEKSINKSVEKTKRPIKEDF